MVQCKQQSMQDEQILELVVCQICQEICWILVNSCCSGSGSADILAGWMCLWMLSSGGISQSSTPGDECVMLLH
jgi:hypothetical protein